MMGDGRGLVPASMVSPASMVPPMAPTVIPPPPAMGTVGFLIVGSMGRSAKQRLKVGN